VGGDNVPINIPPGGQARYVVAPTPPAAFNSTVAMVAMLADDMLIAFACQGMT